MRHTVGEVPSETRLVIAGAVGAGLIFILLLIVGVILSIFNSPAASRIWDIIQAFISGGVGGSVVRLTGRRTPRPRRPTTAPRQGRGAN
jgi:hypothetical protein